MCWWGGEGTCDIFLDSLCCPDLIKKENLLFLFNFLHFCRYLTIEKYLGRVGCLESVNISIMTVAQQFAEIRVPIEYFIHFHILIAHRRKGWLEYWNHTSFMCPDYMTGVWEQFLIWKGVYFVVDGMGAWRWCRNVMWFHHSLTADRREECYRPTRLKLVGSPVYFDMWFAIFE